MSLYYTVRVFTKNSRDTHSVLVKNSGSKSRPWGTASVGGAHRFLWVEEAKEALRTFMSYDGDLGVYAFWDQGRVYHVTEEPVGPVVSRGGAAEEALEHASAAKEDQSATEPPTLDLAHGDELLAAFVSDPDQAELHGTLSQWLVDNADLLLSYARERNRLDWLRQHPESCRAKRDCRSERKEGYIYCEACLADPNAGGYFDVYQRFYAENYNDAVEKILKDINDRLSKVIPPLGSGSPQGQE